MSLPSGLEPEKKETIIDVFSKKNDGTHPMITNQAFAKQSKSGNGQEPINMQRRILMGGALAAALASSGRVLAEENHGGPDNPFILLLKGIYKPVSAADAPANNLGLSKVNLSDGSYSRTRIYPIFGILESNDQDRPIGKFYVQFAGNLCAYDLPGGALAMSFNDVPADFPKKAGYNDFTQPYHPDGNGGFFLDATFELPILEATGIYRDFQGGHNHMVDRLHQLPNSAGFDEFCFCNISQYQFP